jgi:NodT family efflux transporter outer membrane factor (OMF) lipoprotein
MNLRPVWKPLLFALALGACAAGPDFTPPSPPAETGYTPGGALALAAVPGEPVQGFVSGDRISSAWWTLFRSPALDAVVKQAIAGNHDLAAARANLDAAQEVADAARGGLYPQLDLAAAAERRKLNFAAFGLKQPPETFNTFSVGPSVSYSLDPFGKNRRLVEERDAQAQIQAYQVSATYLALTGNAVNDALTIASLNAQLAAAQDIIKADRDLLDLVQKSVTAGGATGLDVETARSQLAIDRTLLPPLRQRLSIVRHALAVLVAEPPSEWSPPDFTVDSLALPEKLPVSLPSALVHQRPDILAAEAELHAASAAVGVATAALYPDITITGAGGVIASGTGALFTPGSTIWNFASGLTFPVFHGGALDAQKRAAEADYNAAVAAYQQTVLAAFAQVADLLDALQHDTELLAGDKAALASASRALDLNRRAYQAGDATLLQVLDASRQHQRARLDFVRAQVQRHLDTAALFVAMGGGWWQRPDLSAPVGAPTAAAQ